MLEQQKIVEKGWGSELWIVNNHKYCGKRLEVLPKKWCSIHFHKNKEETFFILNGCLLLEYCQELYLPFLEKVKGKDNFMDVWYKYSELVFLEPNESFTLKTNMAHRFTPSSDTPFSCTFLEFSTHHKDSDSYRLLKGD